MTAKARFLQRLQEHKNGVFNSKGQADIAEFRHKIMLLEEEVTVWLSGTGIIIERVAVPVVEILLGSGAFSIPGITFRLDNRQVKFTPVFLYGQSVTGGMEVSLCMNGNIKPLYRLFMRAGTETRWTYRQINSTSVQHHLFTEDAFFDMLACLFL